MDFIKDSINLKSVQNKTEKFHSVTSYSIHIEKKTSTEIKILSETSQTSIFHLDKDPGAISKLSTAHLPPSVHN